jgi:hypothetical protein
LLMVMLGQITYSLGLLWACPCKIPHP